MMKVILSLFFISLSFAKPQIESLEVVAQARTLSLCGWTFESRDLSQDYDRIYYRWRDFSGLYEGLNKQLSEKKISAQQCWVQVEKAVKERGVPGEFEFVPRGAPLEFRQWYDRWYQDRFNQTDPGSMRSFLNWELEYLADLSLPENQT